MPFGYNFSLDTTIFQYIDFKGYEGIQQKSEISGMDRLFYKKESKI